MRTPPSLVRRSGSPAGAGPAKRASTPLATSAGRCAARQPGGGAGGGRELRPRRARRGREQPEDGRAGAAARSRSGAPASRASRSASAIGGHSETAARWRSLCSSSLAAGSGAPWASAEPSSSRSSASSSRVRAQAEPVGLRVDGRRREPAGERQHEQLERSHGVAQRLELLARARREPAARRDLRGDVGAELGGELAQQSRRRRARTRPRRGAARRRRRPSRRRAPPRPGSA